MLLALAGQTHSGTGVPAGVTAQPGLVAVSLGQNAAHDYNPFGTGPENHEQVDLAVDSDPNTAWSTAHYYDDTLKKTGGAGVGLYVDAAPGVAARQLVLLTPTPGFGVQIYGANHIDLELAYGSSTPLTQRGWVGPLGSAASVGARQRIAVDSDGRRFRYYLVWITTLPPGQNYASIAEVTLFR